MARPRSNTLLPEVKESIKPVKKKTGRPQKYTDKYILNIANNYLKEIKSNPKIIPKIVTISNRAGRSL